MTNYQRQFNYTALSPLGGQTAHIQFRGPYHGEEVLWDTHLITLQETYRQGIAAGKYLEKDTISLSQFIEINEKDTAEFELIVGIDVPTIDVPTVLKTIIMIHNYKRLRPGRHEYGPSRQFS
ncbi:MAG: hypothetical protein HKM94_05000 [Halobacteria archaeon]|nr:hypothetical protein [Halobacteria archaeon]